MDSPNGWIEPWPGITSTIWDFIEGQEATDDDEELLYLSDRLPSEDDEMEEPGGWSTLYMSPPPSDTPECADGRLKDIVFDKNGR